MICFSKLQRSLLFYMNLLNKLSVQKVQDNPRKDFSTFILLHHFLVLKFALAWRIASYFKIRRPSFSYFYLNSRCPRMEYLSKPNYFEARLFSRSCIGKQIISILLHSILTFMCTNDVRHIANGIFYQRVWKIVCENYVVGQWLHLSDLLRRLSENDIDK